jgi:hypothetical protein
MPDGVLGVIRAWIDAHPDLTFLAWRVVGIVETAVLALLAGLRATVLWLDAHPGIAVWAQAVAVVAVLAAFVRRRRDRTRETARRQEAPARATVPDADRRIARCRRLVAALRAEVATALDGAAARIESVDRLDREIKNSIALGKIVDLAPLRFTTLGITDGVAFRALGAEIGLLPPAPLGGVVTFYNRVAELGRALAAAKTVQQQIWLLQETVPRLRLDGAILVAQLDRLAAAGFDDDADLALPDEEIAALKAKIGDAPAKLVDDRRASR